MPYFRIMEDDGQALTEWVRVENIEITNFPSDIGWHGKIGMIFEHHPDSDLSRFFGDERRKNIVVSTQRDGGSFNTFHRVVLRTFEVGTLDYYNDRFTAQAEWLFENSALTYEELDDIITRHSTPRIIEQEEDISWKKYGF